MASANTSTVQKKNKIKDILSTFVDAPPPDKNKPSPSSDVSCNPQSKDLFLQRVKTFTTTNWAAKPNVLSPLRCAQYGWRNEQPDQLRCVTCNATLHASIPDDWDNTAYNEICTKIQNDLQIGHETLCPWPDNPCPPSFLSLPAHSLDQWRAELKSSFEGLLLLKRSLPELNEDEIASLKLLDNSCIELLLHQVFKYDHDKEDDTLQAKVSALLAITGWCASQPIVEDPSITCTICGKEAGLWNFKSISGRTLQNKRLKTSFDCMNQSHQSIPDMMPDNMSANVSVKSEKSETEKSDYSGHGSVTNDFSRLATSSDSLVQSDLMRPAGSQESLVNLRVSDSKQMEYEQEEGNHDNHDPQMKPQFLEPRLPHATPPELMKELLLSRAPGSRSRSRYSDSIFSEVGSECFEKRLEETTEKEIEHEKAINENPPLSNPNSSQQQWMKELLFMAADTHTSDPSESVASEIGSVAFDRRIGDTSVLNSPRALTPVHQPSSTGADYEDSDGEPLRTKRMRFQVADNSNFSVIDEHRHWCPWVCHSDHFSPTHAQTKVPGRTYAPSAIKVNESPRTENSNKKIFPMDNSTASERRLERKAGWKTLLFRLLPSANRTAVTSPPPAYSEAWKSVRSTLNDCISVSHHK